MIIYDKAQWQLDEGIDRLIVENHFAMLFEWLNEKELLNNDGQEILDLDTFGDASLHSGLLTEEGNTFIEKYYDQVLESCTYGTVEFVQSLNKLYSERQINYEC